MSIYANTRLFSCPDCREFVEGVQRPYCRLNPYLCARCSLNLGEAEDSGNPPYLCPRCQSKLDVIIAGRGPNPLSSARDDKGKAHFLRLASGPGIAYGKVAGFLAEIRGDLSDRPGMWWGEGSIVQWKGLEVLIYAELFLQESALNHISRWEIELPNSGKPWFAVDFAALRRGLEESGEHFRHAWTTWVVSGPKPGVRNTGVGDPLYPTPVAIAEPALDYARIFHGLLNYPEASACLLAIHDGSAWVPWRELRMRMEYSQERVVWLEANGTVSGKEGLPDTSVQMPFWVDVFRDETRLIRWRQHDMKLEFRRNADPVD